MFDMGTFSLSDMLQCAAGVREAAGEATSMEEAAEDMVRYLHDHLLDKATDRRALALTRLYKTHLYSRLGPDLQDFARREAGADADPDTVRSAPCLTLLASAGERPEWQDPASSQRHRAIPLTSVAALRGLPMVQQLVHEVGMDPDALVSPDPYRFRHLDQRTFGVFHVAEAAGSPHIPDQDFVRDQAIRSALGFGGVLPSGSFFAVVMFSRVPIGTHTADAFSTVALSVKLGLLPFADGRVFRSDPPSRGEDPGREVALLRSKVGALEALLETRQSVVTEQSVRLEQTARQAEERADALARSQQALAEQEAHKSAILDATLDCIVTMDGRGRIVDFNPAAERTFGYPRDEVIGREMAELIIPADQRDLHRQGLARYLATGEGRIVGTRVELDALRRNGTTFPVELTVTSVPDVGSVFFTGYVRDITERRVSARQLSESAERFARVAQTLQDSLLPPVLPEIPGLSLASLYLSAMEGSDVGGDFYDVFETARNDWAITLGDVMGKGVEAAALTGLARYTLRAAAIRARRPEAVLSVLNEAINRQHPERFCTVAYARLRMDGRGMRLTVASGGHPPAIRITAAGRVQLIDAPGMLIGPFPDWHGVQRSIPLGPGEHFVLYSDGVLDARRGQELFGLEGLVEVLEGRPPSTASDTVARIEAAVMDFSGGSKDDVAILVVARDQATRPRPLTSPPDVELT